MEGRPGASPPADEPRFVRVLERLIDARYRAEVSGDLMEEYRDRLWAGSGSVHARAWLAWQVVRAAAASRWHDRRLDASPAEGRPPSRSGGEGMLRQVRQDLSFAYRTLVRAPLFTTVALLTLSLGLGATIAVYAVVDGVLLRPLPYEDPERLVLVRGAAQARWAVTYPDYADLAAAGPSFASLAVWQGWSVVVDDEEGIPTRRSAASVGWTFFDVLGVRPAAGRFFLPEDGRAGHAPVVVLSHRAWVRDFGGRPDVVGRAYPLDGESYTIVGVAPLGFVDPVAYATWGGDPELWRADPPVFSREAADRGWIGFWVMGRLRDGASAARAQANVDAVIQAAYAGVEEPPSATVVTLLDATVEGVRRTLYVLLGAVALVLLIACANVANLLLSRASVREHEVAVRRALGASRGRLIAQLLTESVLLSLAAGAAGMLVAAAGARVLVAQAGAELPRAWDVAVDWRIAAAAFAAAMLTALLFGLAPALQLTRDSAATLREGGRGGTGARRGLRMRSLLVVAETALAVVLLVSAGLLLRTFWKLQQIDPGFEAESALALRVGLPEVTFPTPAEQVLALQRVVDEVSATPGVTAAGAITDLPMGGAVNSTSIFRDDQPRPEPGEARSALVRATLPGYFAAMRIPRVRGREFDGTDRDSTRPVAIVNATFVDVFFPDDDPIGRTVTVRGVSREIVGIVADAKEFTLTGGPDAVLYEPFAQEREPWMRAAAWVVVRHDAQAPAMLSAVRNAIRRAHGRIPINTARTLETVLADDMAAPRFRALLVVLFGALALLLAAVGVAGVLAYMVSQRTREIGIRLAVGATSIDVMRMVAAESARLTGAGVALGLLAAAAAARVLGSFLFGIASLDFVVFASVPLVLVAVGLAASALPARRAAAVDPNTALRAD